MSATGANDLSIKDDQQHDIDTEVVEKLQSDGCELAASGNFEGALQKWAVALNLSPRSHQLHELSAQALLALELWPVACLAAERAVALEPCWGEGHLTLARCRRELGEVDLSVASYQLACELEPDNSDFLEEYEEMKGIAARYIEWKQEHLQLYAAEENAEAKACLENLTSRAAVAPCRLHHPSSVLNDPSGKVESDL